ncbi:MAG TPA: hypothetical protein VE869_04975 [Gemmatimonas sp.]|nr:hypothetical protein [Gemmatimonas sp.]
MTHPSQPHAPVFRAWLLLALPIIAACGDTADPASRIIAPGTTAEARARSGTLRLVVNGVPGDAAIAVSGPSGYTVRVTASASLTGLANGTYTVSAERVNIGDATYSPTPASQQVSVSKNGTAQSTVSYSADAAPAPPPPSVTSGSLAVTVSGLPGDIAGAVSVTGANGYSVQLGASRTLSDLATGTYTVSASDISRDGVTYTPSPAAQAASVTEGTTASVAVTFNRVDAPAPPTASPPPSTSSLNLQIAGMYLTQSVQALDGRVPLVAGRSAVLRVFAVANGSNGAQPTVRARFYRSGILQSTLTANAGAGSVPTGINESSASASWNVQVPASLVQPGLTVVADVDPDNSVPESNESDNQYPASGTPAGIDVRAVPTLGLTLVPLVQSPTGQQGGVSEGNKEEFLATTRQLLPVAGINATVRAPYTTSYALSSDGSGWGEVISELWALRAAEGGTGTYYGVARTNYMSGVAGIGYIGAPTALGWDFLPSASSVMAHELGHTWGREHAPCGGVAGADASYPHAGGTIGAYGFNLATGQVVSSESKDLMGYCGPQWVSDYTFRGIMDFRRSSGAMIASAMVTSVAVEQPALLVWGRITASGEMVLEPAVAVDARPVLPERAGRYTVQGVDANGTSMFSLSFDPVTLADTPAGTEKAFAFVVPVSAAAQSALSSIQLRGNGRETRTAMGGADVQAAVDAASLQGAGTGRARLRWNADKAPLVVVRDPETGRVLSFARGGDVTVRTSRSELSLDAPRARVRGARVRVGR